MSPNMIYKVMTGKTGRGTSKAVNLKPETKEAIRKALEILRVGVSTDIHEEVDEGFIKDEKLDGTRFEKLKNKKKRPSYIADVLLDTKVVENVNLDGHLIDDCVYIKDEPILYSYSKMRGQVSTYPLEVLDAPIRNTVDNIAVRGILMRWILMGGKKKDFYKLTYDKIFEAVGIDPADKSSGTNKRRTQIRKTIDDCLIYWKKLDFIRGYTVNRHIDIYRKSAFAFCAVHCKNSVWLNLIQTFRIIPVHLISRSFFRSFCINSFRNNSFCFDCAFRHVKIVNVRAVLRILRSSFGNNILCSGNGIHK